MPRARKCIHCGERATERWDLRPCAIGRWRRIDLCTPCDIELNEIVVRFTNISGGEELLANYRERKTNPAG